MSEKAPRSTAPTPLVDHLARVLLVATLLVATVVNTVPVLLSDTFFHLRIGAEFLDDWSLRSPGSVSATATADWAPTQWLAQAGFALAEARGGLAAVAALTGLMILAATVALFMSARRSGSLIVAVSLTCIALIALAPFLSGRAQVISYAFAAITVAAWLGVSRGGRLPWWLVPLTWIWAMVHGMWVVSVIVSSVAVLGLVLDAGLRGRRLAAAISIPVASLAAAGLTPIGVDVYSSAFRVGSISSYFAEWGPVPFTQPAPAAAALLVGLCVLLAVRSPERLPWLPLFLLALATAWTVYSLRTVPVGAAMAVPLLARQLAPLVGDRGRGSTGERFFLAAGVVASAAAAVALAWVNPSLGSDPQAGSRAHASVDALPAGTLLLNEWSEGGYDMWRHPELDVVMHGYGDMFTDAELERNARITRLDPDWYDDIVDLDLQHALLLTSSRVAAALEQDHGWIVVAEDVHPGEGDSPAMVHLSLTAPAGD